MVVRTKMKAWKWFRTTNTDTESSRLGGVPCSRVVDSGKEGAGFSDRGLPIVGQRRDSGAP
jgi:hypothetical protein